MEYFTTELLGQMLSDDESVRLRTEKKWAENCISYRERFSGLENRLQKGVVNFDNKGSFHDYRFEDLTLRHRSTRYGFAVDVTLILCKGQTRYSLIYKNVEGFKMDYMNDGLEAGLDDLVYEEILDVTEDVLSHEMLFSSGATMKISFRNKAMTLRKMRGTES